MVTKRFPVPAGPKNQNWAKKKIPPGDNPKDSRNTRVQLRKCHKDKICCPKVWSQKGFQYQKSTMHAQNSNFQLSLGFYLDTDQILKVWSPLGKRISLLKFWSQKGFQYLQGPKIKIGQQKKYHLGITLKIPETLEFNLGNVIMTRYASPKFVTDRQTNKQTDRHSQILAQELG